MAHVQLIKEYLSFPIKIKVTQTYFIISISYINKLIAKLLIIKVLLPELRADPKDPNAAPAIIRLNLNITSFIHLCWQWVTYSKEIIKCFSWLFTLKISILHKYYLKLILDLNVKRKEYISCRNKQRITKSQLNNHFFLSKFFNNPSEIKVFSFLSFTR